MASRFTSIGVKLAATIGSLLTVGAGIALTGVLNFSATNSGTSTGAVLQVGGQTRWQTFSSACAGTGGLTGLYSTCYARSPLSTTGTLLGWGIECGNWQVSMSADVSFKKGLFSATGTALTNGNNVTIGTGANLQSMLAVPVSWNPADILAVGSITTPTGTLNTTRYNCTFWPILSDKSNT